MYGNRQTNIYTLCDNISTSNKYLPVNESLNYIESLYKDPGLQDYIAEAQDDLKIKSESLNAKNSNYKNDLRLVVNEAVVFKNQDSLLSNVDTAIRRFITNYAVTNEAAALD